MKKPVLTALFSILFCTAAFSEKVQDGPENNYGYEFFIKGQKIEIYTEPTTTNLQMKIGLHMWNAFDITIRNVSKSSITIKPEENFILLNKETNEQLNALSKDEVCEKPSGINAGPFSPKRGLDRMSCDLVQEIYFTGGKILPGAIKSGVIYFEKKNFNGKTPVNNLSLNLSIDNMDDLSLNFDEQLKK